MSAHNANDNSGGIHFAFPTCSQNVVTSAVTSLAAPEVNRKLHYFIFSFITQNTRVNTKKMPKPSPEKHSSIFKKKKEKKSQSQTGFARYDQDSGNNWLCLNRRLKEDSHLSIKFTYRSPKLRIGELDRGQFINSGRFLHKNERFQKFEGEEDDGEDGRRSRIPRLMQDGQMRTQRLLCSLAGAAVTSSARRRASQNVSVSRKPPLKVQKLSSIENTKTTTSVREKL